MFDIGWSEFLVIGVVAIIVVGPKDLPRMMRTFGHYAGKLRRMAADFQRQFEDAVRDSEIDEVRKAMQDFREQAPSVDFRASVNQPLMTSKPGSIAPPSVVAALEAATPPAAPMPAKAKRKSRSKPATASNAVAVETVPAKTVSAKTEPVGTEPVETVSAKRPAKSPKPRKPVEPKP